MKNFLIVLVSLILLNCKKESSFNQKIEIGNYESISKTFNKNNDTLYVVNFWATWCSPCIEEMPNFTKANDKFKNDKFKMILISLDHVEDFDTKMKPYLKNHSITVDTYLLYESEKSWMSLLNKQWDGKIPVTAFYKNGKQIGFIPNTLNFETLDQIIKHNLKQ